MAEETEITTTATTPPPPTTEPSTPRVLNVDETNAGVLAMAGQDATMDASNIPSGVKYKIIDSTDLPQERDFRDAWEYNFTDSFDGVGG